MNLQYLQRVSDTLDVTVWFPGSEQRQTRGDYFCPADWAPGVRRSCDDRWKHHHILHTDCNKDTSLCSRCLSLNATVVPKTRMHLTFTPTASGCVGDVCTAHVNVTLCRLTERRKHVREVYTGLFSLQFWLKYWLLLSDGVLFMLQPKEKISPEMLMLLP